ncbi:hypothetical protein ThvES_00021170, partial [Thiovulum sp. ES]
RQFFRFSLKKLEHLPVKLRIGLLKVKDAKLPLEAFVYFPPSKIFAELYVENVIYTLNEHRYPLKPVSYFRAHDLNVDPSNLLEIGKLGYFKPIKPNLPTQTPSSQRRTFQSSSTNLRSCSDKFIPMYSRD